MTEPATERRGHPRLVLLGLVALFAAPVLLAWLLSSHRDWLPGSTVNHGTLLTPLQQLPLEDWREHGGEHVDLLLPYGQWRLLAVESDGCAEDCRARLDLLGRLRLSLGHQLDRVQWMLVLPSKPDSATEAAAESAGFSVVQPPEATPPAWPRSSGGVPYVIYIVDYRGHLVLGYPPDADARGIQKDLRRLLRGSSTE